MHAKALCDSERRANAPTLILFLILVSLIAAGGARANASLSKNVYGQTISGWFSIFWIDDYSGSGKSSAEYVLVDEEGNWSRIILDNNLTKSAGRLLFFNRKRVTLTGDMLNTPHKGFLARQIQLAQSEDFYLPASGVHSQEVFGSKPYVAILCRFADSTNVTPHERDWFEGLMGANYPGTDHFWREVSYNAINLIGSTVVGWYNLPHPRSYYVHDMDGDGIEDYFDVGGALNDCTAVADNDVFFPDFFGIALMFNDEVHCRCAGSGWPNLTLDGQTKQYALAWQPRDLYTALAHEMGHGFGIPHSSGPYDDHYDSLWDVMSGGGTCSDPHPEYGCINVHTIANHKDRMGWIAPGRKYVAKPGSNKIITLERLGQPTSDSDYLIAQIPLGDSPIYFYTVEARRFAGYDSQIPGEAVIIHQVDLTLYHRAAQVVDVDNDGDPNDPGAMWTPGEAFTDATYGITVSVNAETGSGFTVTIDVAPIPPFVNCASQTQIPQAECDALEALYNDTNGASWSNNRDWLSNPWPCLWHGVTCSDGHVTVINLSENQLDGIIPSEIGNLVNLQYLYLDINQLSGKIPAEIGNLGSLQWLTLNRNQLSGNIPPTLGNLANLQGLILWANYLSGSIPVELGNLTNLQYLDLGNNQLSDNIPPDLGSLANLNGLLLYGNQLSGHIPPELGNLVNLDHLYLDSNPLSGSIPAEIGNLTNLRKLYFNNSQLSGSIPLELSNLNLMSFWFDNTNLCEPSEPAFQTWIANIPDVSSTNLLCGAESVFLPIVAR